MTSKGLWSTLERPWALETLPSSSCLWDDVGGSLWSHCYYSSLPPSLKMAPPSILSPAVYSTILKGIHFHTDDFHREHLTQAGCPCSNMPPFDCFWFWILPRVTLYYGNAVYQAELWTFLCLLPCAPGWRILKKKKNGGKVDLSKGKVTDNSSKEESLTLVENVKVCKWYLWTRPSRTLRPCSLTNASPAFP